MNANWIDIAANWRSEKVPFVIVTVLASRGSTPVEVGRRMLVASTKQFGTIGGGRLENQTIENARDLLQDKDVANLDSLALGAKLGQCCGGKVYLHYELTQVETANIVVFGAGHVAQELAKLLVSLPYTVDCYDERIEWVDKLPIAKNFKAHFVNDLVDEVTNINPNSYCLIMTHKHDLDLMLCKELLAKKSFALVGVIGSKSKSLRFQRELKGRKLDLTNFACPIGEKAGKSPTEVAIMIAAKVCQQISQAINGVHESDKASARLLEKLVKEVQSQDILTAKK